MTQSIIFFSICFLLTFLLLLKDKSFFICVYLVILLLHDYIFISIGAYNQSFFLKGWQEYIFVVVVFLYTNKVFKNKGLIGLTSFDKRFIKSIIGLSSIGIVAGIINNNSLIDSILHLRLILLPVVFVFLISKIFDLKKLNLKLLNRTIIIFSFLLIFYAIFQVLTFSGDISDSWKFDFMFSQDSRGLSSEQFRKHRVFNFLKDGKLRANSFFVSSIDFSFFLGLAFNLILYYFLFNKNKNLNKLVQTVVFLSTFILGIYLSQTRIGLGGISISLIVAFIIYIKPRTRLYELILVPLCFIILVFFAVTYGLLNDASALGRLVQPAKMIDDFKIIGNGLGDGIRYDSLYLSVAHTFGLFSIIYLYFYFLIIKYIFNYNNILCFLNKMSIHLKVCFMSVLTFGITSIFLFYFHYSLSSTQLYVFFLVSILLIKTIEQHGIYNTINSSL